MALQLQNIAIMLVDNVSPTVQTIANALTDKLSPTVQIIANTLTDKVYPTVQASAHLLANKMQPTMQTIAIMSANVKYPTIRPKHANAAFLAVWLILALYCYSNSYDDPSSIFFNEKLAFRERFSLVRTTNAEHLIEVLTYGPPTPKIERLPGTKPFLCIGVPSVARNTVSFLPQTLATLVDTLTDEERSTIHLVTLLADQDPKDHPAYEAPWLDRLVDEAIVYSAGNWTLPPQPEDPKDHPAYEAPWLDRLVDEAIVYSAGNWTLPPQPEGSVTRAIPYDVRHAGRGTERVENMRLDHSVVLDACRSTGAQYFALVEDDIVASRDWFTRLKAGIAGVEQRKASRPKAPDWLYFRLFYSEIFMGWNSEEWLGYSRVIFEFYVLALVVFLVLRRTWPAASLGAQGKRTVTTYRHTSAWIAALVFGLWLPALIVLYFAAGRVSTHRMTPWSSDGVREMPNYGCCAQGLVFPQRHFDMIHDMLVTPPFNFPGDMMLEDVARDKQLKKWALEPSVFQHVGLKESSDGTQRKEVWNFSFERQQ
ncbi:hypothetical protein VdG1_08829 [Verticillium dahliae VDG1]|nr:hypothetical protein VdG1_08829 [Verticillium dahliae VDG1]